MSKSQTVKGARRESAASVVIKQNTRNLDVLLKFLQQTLMLEKWIFLPRDPRLPSTLILKTFYTLNSVDLYTRTRLSTVNVIEAFTRTMLLDT
jgi:hypothetical protein